ncbi:MAG: hypothetical protein Q7U76_13100 [Nitrospirota bacterium]|nr:hypothetical protein [Nitrospirota bacterium]
MPPNERVGINVQATFRADTSQAKQAFDEFTRSSTQAAQRMQGSVGDRDSASSRAKQLLKEQLGDNFSFIRQQKEVNSILHEQRQHYRELSDNLYRQERAVKNLGGEEEKAAMKRVRRMRDEKREMAGLVHALESHKAVGMAAEGGSGRAGMLSGLSMSGAMNGGVVGSALGRLGALAMSNPISASVIATLGGLHFLDKFTSGESKYSEDIDVSMANVGRRTGGGLNLRSMFEQNPGRISDTFKNMGYTGEHLAGMMQAYSMPGGASAMESQGRFARKFGFGESPEMISGLGRRATQLGTAEPAQQGQFWALMTVAVEKGLKNGVDASETMRSLLGMTEQVAAHTGVVSQSYVAGLAGMQSSLSSGDSRFFKGEMGAHHIGKVLQGFQNPQSIAQERFVMNSIREHFGGTPTAGQLKLSGGDAEAYGQMPEVQQLQYVMQKLPELMKSNPGLMASLVRSMASGAGPGMQSMMAGAAFNMSAGEVAAMHSSLYGSLKGGGMSEKRLHGMGALDLLGEVIGRSPGEAQQILRGDSAGSPLTDAERARTLDKMNLETWSSSFSRGSMGLRLGVKGAKSGIAESFEHAAKDAFGTPSEEVQQQNRIREMEREMMYGNGGSVYKQSYGGGESMNVNPVEVTGSIQLIGADGVSLGQVPAAAIGLLIQKAIQDQSGTPRAGSPRRPRLLAQQVT